MTSPHKHDMHVAVSHLDSVHVSGLLCATQLIHDSLFAGHCRTVFKFLPCDMLAMLHEQLPQACRKVCQLPIAKIMHDCHW